MNSKGHLYVSLAKSIFRIASGIIAVKTGDFRVLAIGFVIAEGLGVIEELVDWR